MKKNLLLNLFLFCFTPIVGAAEAIDLEWPATCKMGKECFAYQLGNNTDISIYSKNATQPNHNVVAAAAGKVKRIRDKEDVAGVGKDCGNGIIIEHGNGWETQYCHLGKDSIVVHVDEKVKAGKVLGKIGASGQATRDGVYFIVRHNGEEINPFTAHLWRDKTLTYKETSLIDLGMSEKPIDFSSLSANPPHKNLFSRTDPAMIAWVRAFNIKKGDQQKFVFYSPDGNIYRQAIEEIVKTDHSEWIAAAGYPLQNKNIPVAYNGEWRMVYSIKRGETPWQELGEVRFKLEN
jgi:hypothetical protein